MASRIIVEKKLKIPADYQYHALTKGSWFQKFWHLNKLRLADDCLKFNKTQVVLDLGTGSGNFELLYHARIKKIDCVDYNDEALEFLNSKLLEKRIKNISLYLSRLPRLPTSIKIRKYDLIILMDIIEHLHYSDVALLLRRLCPLLRRDGRLFLVTPNYSSLWRYLEMLLESLHLVPKFTNEQHITQFDSNNIAKIIRESELKIVQQGSFNLFSWLFPNSKINRFLLHLEKIWSRKSGCLLYLVAKRAN